VVGKFEEYVKIMGTINWREMAPGRKEWRRILLEGKVALLGEEREKKFGAITVENQLRLSSQNIVPKVHWLGPANVGADRC
jgi:hypothetical protein